MQPIDPPVRRTPSGRAINYERQESALPIHPTVLDIWDMPWRSAIVSTREKPIPFRATEMSVAVPTYREVEEYAFSEDPSHQRPIALRHLVLQQPFVSSLKNFSSADVAPRGGEAGVTFLSPEDVLDFLLDDISRYRYYVSLSQSSGYGRHWMFGTFKIVNERPGGSVTLWDISAFATTGGIFSPSHKMAGGFHAEDLGDVTVGELATALRFRQLQSLINLIPKLDTAREVYQGISNLVPDDERLVWLLFSLDSPGYTQPADMVRYIKAASQHHTLEEVGEALDHIVFSLRDLVDVVEAGLSVSDYGRYADVGVVNIKEVERAVRLGIDPDMAGALLGSRDEG